MLKVLAELKSLDAFVAGDAVVVALQEPGKLPLCEQEIDPALVGKRDVSPEICDNEVKSVTIVKVGLPTTKSEPTIRFPYKNQGTSTAIPIIDDTVTMRPSTR